jgi:hypothetical protein
MRCIILLARKPGVAIAALLEANDTDTSPFVILGPGAEPVSEPGRSVGRFRQMLGGAGQGSPPET